MPPTIWAFSPKTQAISLSLSLYLYLSHMHSLLLLTWTFSPTPTLTRINLLFTSATIIQHHTHIIFSTPSSFSLFNSQRTLFPNLCTPTSPIGVMRHHRHFHWLRTFTTFTFLLFSSVLAITTLTPQPSGGAVKHLNREENLNGSPALPVKRSVEEEKRFGGPGSSPPSCRSKCGWCNPCIPVHVPVQPGLIIRLEYYPEAWRCKCGNKLFMP